MPHTEAGRFADKTITIITYDILLPFKLPDSANLPGSVKFF